MITQRSHQYLPRGRHAWRLASRVASLRLDASCDTGYRVTARGRAERALPGSARGESLRYRDAMRASASPLSSLDPQADASVHPLVRKTAAWSWRLLIILGALVALVWVVEQLEVIVVPVLLATMVTAMLLPLVDYLDRRGLPRGAAVAGRHR